LGAEISEISECDFPLPSIAQGCPANTIAAHIESGLYSDVPEHRIDVLLKKEIERRCFLLDDCRERHLAAIEENRRKLYSRWGVKETE
jgi:hypothetical protein